jgi:uncharacterized Rossmann fold enzyme
MRWDAWRATDAAIRAEFGYPVAEDAAAAHELCALVPKNNRFRDLGVEVRNRRNVVVLGCGPSLESADASVLARRVVVAADGACTWLRERNAVPHIVVTDLDGRAEDLEWAARQGAAMVVHAHGDNRDAIAALAPRLLPRLYGTYQGPEDPSLEPMRNVGGFTDGDRAVMLLEELGALAALLVGFDFHEPPSRYSHRFNATTKPAKLAWAERIVEGVQARRNLSLRRYAPPPAQ